MKSIPILIPALFLGGAALFAQDVYQPLPSASNPYVGHGGNGMGRSRPLNDLELTAITRATESVETLMADQTTARNELTAASLMVPASAANLAARAQAIAEAELKLAHARFEAFAKLKSELKATTPAKAQAIANALQSTATGRGGGGGGGGAAAAGGRAGAPGAAAPAGAAMPAGRGN